MARSASNFATLVPQKRLKIKYFANFIQKRDITIPHVLSPSVAFL